MPCLTKDCRSLKNMRRGYCFNCYLRKLRRGEFEKIVRTSKLSDSEFVDYLIDDCTEEDSNGCLNWTKALASADSPIQKRGYKSIHVRRFIYEQLNDFDLREDEYVQMICMNSKCLNIEHMKLRNKSEWGVTSHTYRNGKNFKLTLEQVEEIRASNLNKYELAWKYNVSKANIEAILEERTWKPEILQQVEEMQNA